MAAVLAQLDAEDSALEDPTLMDPQAGRALAVLTSLRWAEDLPKVAEARTVMIANLAARQVTPPDDAGTEGILFIHGGGWAFGSAATHEGAARRLALATGAQVVTPEYRLAPEDPYPAGLEDVLEAWAARDRSRRWSIAGDSAGANLAMAVMLRLMEFGEELPAQGLLFYGVFDDDFNAPSYVEFAKGFRLTRAMMRRFWDWYAHRDLRHRADVVPMKARESQLQKLPPLYLNAAGLDPLRSEAEAMAARLQGLGRDDTFDLVEGVVHGFMQMGSVLPEARETFERVGAVFRARAV